MVWHMLHVELMGTGQYLAAQQAGVPALKMAEKVAARWLACRAYSTLLWLSMRAGISFLCIRFASSFSRGLRHGQHHPCQGAG